MDCLPGLEVVPHVVAVTGCHLDSKSVGKIRRILRVLDLKLYLRNRKLVISSQPHEFCKSIK